MHGTAVERKRLDRAVSVPQDRAAGRFVNAARLHANKTILDKIDAADAVVTPQVVELCKKRCGRQLFAVERNGITFFKSDRDNRCGIGRLLRRDRALVNVVRWLHRRIFQHLALGGGMQQVGVD